MRYDVIIFALVLILIVGSMAAQPQTGPTQKVQMDPKQLEQACDGGDLDACVKLGEFYDRGLGGLKKDKLRSVSLFERACTGGNFERCDYLGNYYTSWADSAHKDATRAAQFWEKACDGKHAPACTNLGRAYGGRWGFERDSAKALSLHERGCALGDSGGCMELAVLHHPGKGAHPDAQRWAASMEKVCDDNRGDVCLQLGLHYDLGLFVPKDTAHADELFKKGCLYRNEKACDLIRR